VLDPRFFPPGWGTEGLGAGGIYGPIYDTFSGPGFLSPGPPPSIPKGWTLVSSGGMADLYPPWFDYSITIFDRPSSYPFHLAGEIYTAGQVYSTDEESTD